MVLVLDRWIYLRMMLRIVFVIIYGLKVICVEWFVFCSVSSRSVWRVLSMKVEVVLMSSVC